MMRRKSKRIVLSTFIIFIILIIRCIIVQSRVVISPGEGFSENMYMSKDSILIMNRHMGYIRYDRFVNLIKDKLTKAAPTDISVRGDSVYFRTKYPHYFYGQNDNWIRQYKNLPIHITNEGFKAKLQTIDTIQYVLIPYQILSNVAKIEDDSTTKDK